MPQPANTLPRAYSAAHFGLELDNVKKTVGLFRSCEGGGVSAEMISYQTGENYDIWRQLAKPKYEDIKVQVGMAMSEPFYNWIADFFAGTPTRKNGAIIAADFYYTERARREFESALITECAFPALKGDDKNAAYMTITMAPEKMKFIKGDGHKIKFEADENLQKLWTANNFRFRIDGLEKACTRTTKIDSFTIKQKVIDHHVGGQRHPIRVPGRIEIPNVTFYVPEVDAQPIIDEFLKHSVDKAEPSPIGKNATIETYDNQNQNLFDVKLINIRLKSAIPDKSDANSEEIKQVKFEMACEMMSFTYLRMELE